MGGSLHLRGTIQDISLSHRGEAGPIPPNDRQSSGGSCLGRARNQQSSPRYQDTAAYPKRLWLTDPRPLKKLDLVMGQLID
jgi:hypothetical protein